MKKVLSAILVLIMLLSMIPFCAWADEEGEGGEPFISLGEPADDPTGEPAGDLGLFLGAPLLGDSPDNYNVSFYDGLDNKLYDQRVVPDSKAEKPSPDPTKPGYTFINWYSDSGLITPFDFDNTQIKADTDIYAKFEPITYSIHFDPNSDIGTSVIVGSVPEDINNAKYDNEYTIQPCTLKRDGYTLSGWTTQKGGKEKEYQTEDKVKNLCKTDGGTATLYAVWKPITITVEFVIDDGGGVKDKQLFEYDNPQPLKSFTRDYYAFEKWTSNYKEYADKEKFNPTEYYDSEGKTTLVLTANWSERKYTVKLKTYIYHKVEVEDEESGKKKTVWKYELDYAGEAGYIYWAYQPGYGYFGDTQIVGDVSTSQLASWAGRLDFSPKTGYYVDKANMDYKTNIKKEPLKRDGVTLTTDLVYPTAKTGQITIRVYFKPGSGNGRVGAALTGDDFDTWMAIAGISLIGAAGTGIMYKKKRRKEE